MKRAIQKHGIENFNKEILEIYDSEAKMNLAEKILVVVDFEVSYNICSGGNGGFGYINKNVNLRNKMIISVKKKYGDDFFKNHCKKMSIKGVESLRKNKKGFAFDPNLFYIREKYNTKEHLDKMSIRRDLPETNIKRKETFKLIGHSKGSKNSQYGTYWITNDKENKKIKKEDLDFWIINGYKKGRNLTKT